MSDGERAAPNSLLEATLMAFEAKVEHHYAMNDGVRIHYAAIGTGPLVVCLHGFPDHWLGWWQVMARLMTEFRMVAIDMRGYNLSDKPAEREAYSIRNLVGDVRAVIEHNGADRATLIGHDWGGFVAWHAAMDDPSLVERLIVLNMPHPWAISRELANNPRQRQASEYVRMFRNPPPQMELPPSRLGFWVKDAAYRVRHDRAMTASSTEGMLAYYQMNWPSEPYRQRATEPPSVKAPTLLIHGLEDAYALPEGLNDVWRWIENELSIQLIPHAGHFIQHDHAERVSVIVRNWRGRA